MPKTNINIEAVIAHATLRAAQHDFHKSHGESHEQCEFCRLDAAYAASERELKAIAERLEGDLLWQHSKGEHSEPNAECGACEIVLSADELLREHRGW